MDYGADDDSCLTHTHAHTHTYMHFRCTHLNVNCSVLTYLPTYLLHTRVKTVSLAAMKCQQQRKLHSVTQTHTTGRRCQFFLVVVLFCLGRVRCPGFLAVRAVDGVLVTPSDETTVAVPCRWPLSFKNRLNSRSFCASSDVDHTVYGTV